MGTLEETIREFDARVREIERVSDTLNRVLLISPESEFYSAIWSIIHGYMEAISAVYPIGGWLEWWWLDCGLGSWPHQAGLPGEELRTIATIDDLVRIVCDDIARSA